MKKTRLSKISKKDRLERVLKTQERIEALQAHIKYHQRNIKRLHDFAEGRETLSGNRYTQEANRYVRTKHDKQRLPWAINNINKQIQSFEKELDLLIEYGA